MAIIEPWEYPIFVGIGIVGVHAVVDKHEVNKKEVDQLLKYMGREPMERK